MAYDHLDEHLVNALLDDGRATISELAESVNASVTTVSNHLHQLEEEGLIRGFAPLVNYEAFGYDVMTISHLKVDGNALETTIEWLADHDRFVSIFEVTGDHDIMVIGTFRDTEEMNDHLKEFLAFQHITETNTSMVLTTVRQHEQFPLPVPGE